MIEDGNSTEITRDHVAMIDTAKLGDNPRVCIFAAFNEAYQSLADIARPNWKAYAERHNYAVRFYPRGFHTDPSHHESYGDKNRFNWYFDLCGHADIVVYLDIDSLFVNMDTRIEDQLVGRFTWTYANGGPMSGLMIARTDDVTERHLRFAYNLAAAENNVRHGEIEPNGISDQDAMTRLMHVPPFSQTFGNCVPAESVGFCYPEQFENNPFIITCRGGSFEEKLATMQQIALAKSVGTFIGIEGLPTLATPTADNSHAIPAYNPKFAFDRNWVGPPELKPRVYRTQSEKDTVYAVLVENEYRAPAFAPDDVIVDIGAHIGSFSWRAYLNGSRTIYAFEIDPWHMEAANINLAEMRDGVQLYHMAVVRGDELRAAEYHYDGAWNSFGLHGTVVRSTSLDEIIERAVDPIRFLKIDCEGGEYPILYTCTAMDRIQEIAGEWHRVDPSAPELQGLPYETNEVGLQRFLESCGFDVEVTHGGEGNGGFFAKRPAGVNLKVRHLNFGTVVKLS